jgi:predicted Zn-dependent protease
MSFRNLRPWPFVVSAILGGVLVAHAELPDFFQHTTAGSAFESALFRLMDLPGVKALYPRPPKEAQAELAKLIAQEPHQAEVYSLKAREDEQALDFVSAESDWKAYAAHAQDRVQAQLALAAFYHRRLKIAEEVQVLNEVGTSAPLASEAFTPIDKQQSWDAFAQIVKLAADNGLDQTVTQQAYDAWRSRYPHESAVYANEFNWLLSTKQYDAASALLLRYKATFPDDPVLPVKAAALLALRQSNIAQAIAVYDNAFQPLWPQNLIDSYFGLLAEAHQQRAFLGEAKARLEKSPDDFASLCRIYFYQLQNGHADVAQSALDQYRISKDARKVAWKVEELFTLMKLNERAGNWPEAARYAFALYNLPSAAQIEGRSASETGLASMTRILLTAPDQPLLLGAQNLSMYRDIATLDQGPGYWNGILSLWLNSSSPSSEFHGEETAAQPYFHRAKAASLLQMLDTKFPNCSESSTLHAGLISVYAEYAQSDEVIRSATDYLKRFPNGSERVAVAMQMADAYSRLNDTKDELALYDRLLAELGAKTQGMPLTAATASVATTTTPTPPTSDAPDEASDDTPAVTPAAFEIVPATKIVSNENAADYSKVLERYLSLLVSTNQMQSALAVLRHELDRNPNDPLLYERLAQFLEQNKLDAQQEEVYKTAIAHFADKSWYDKLARLYLREKHNEAYADLTRQVTKTFEGTDLEDYFRTSGGVGSQMSLQLNLYATQRFPHDLVFIRNLLDLYAQKPTRDDAARLALLRIHWWEASDLQSEFFETLSSTGKLDAELQQLQAMDRAQSPVASRELAEAEIWRSHFEESATPLGTLAALYPADVEIGDRAASVFRSLAYFDSAQTEKAVAIEKNLILANPGDLDRLATIGDIYADAGSPGSPGHEDLVAAELYWRRLSQVNPSSRDGYLQAATVFWDYFEFDQALEQIHLAREKFNEPALYGYEAGAICEGQRNMSCAIREYLAAALAGDEESSSRLTQLSTRASSSGLVDAALASAGDATAAMTLREDILVAQDKRAAIGPLLASELAKASTVDDVAAIASRAQARSLPLIYESALIKEASLSADPIEKMQLQYALAHSEEDRKDVPAAAKVIAAVYAQNPRILGVVRVTVDFDWRTGSQRQAINILTSAAKVARPDLAHPFLLEAAAKANEIGDYPLARQIIAPLSDASPYDPQIMATIADSYARANDNAALRDFYLAKIVSIKSSTLPGDMRKQTILLLRRGLIPALTRMKDYPGAVDQYIAMLSAYPEDESLIQEAALYALRWQQTDHLIQFVQTTATQSPRDSRFAAMLAEMQTVFENFPAALDAWSHAVAIRADKQEWFSAKADLEIRLNRLDDACADYERLYMLSYKDARWMIAEAEIRAQQGRRPDAVAALEKAYVSGHTPVAGDMFEIASQLETWNMLEEARHFAEQGLKLAGSDLLLDDADGASTYMKIMARLRQTEPAIAVMNKSLSAAVASANSPTILAEQVQKQGIASVTDEDWRKRRAQERSETAHSSYTHALQAMATTIGTYGTPEEKMSFAYVLRSRTFPTAVAQLAALAGLKDIEASYLRDQLRKSTSAISPSFRSYADLEISRMQFTELGQALEAYSALLAPSVDRSPIKQQAIAAYRYAGDEMSELRVTESLRDARTAGAARDRFFALLLRRNQPQLFKLAASNNERGDAATDYAMAHADEPIALRALSARSTGMLPVWNSAYRALTGLYFQDFTPSTDDAFHAALSDLTIADRLAHPVDRNRSLAGDTWFYYGMRYAVFRLNGGPGDAEDFAASELEHAATFDAYVNLARVYADANKPDAALTEYNHALEIQPDNVSVQDAIAEVLWKAGRHTEAISEWTSAIDALQEQISLQAAPASFFTNTELIARHSRQFVGPQLHAPLTALLKAYLAKNGTYRSNELLLAVLDASASPTAGVEWIIDLSSASAQQDQILADIQNAFWIPQAARVRIYLKRIQLAHSATNLNEDNLVHLQTSLASLYIELKDYENAKSVLAAIPETQSQNETLMDARILLAAHEARLANFLSSLDALPDSEQPDDQTLRKAQSTLTSAGDSIDARLIAEHLFTRNLVRHKLTANDYLSVADARLSTKDVAGALELLRRMTLLPNAGDRFANTDLAASLLEKSDHPVEAIAFLASLAAGRPWNADYGIRLAEAQLKSPQSSVQGRASLAMIASSQLSTYEERSRAASDLHGDNLATLGSRELNLLTVAAITPEQARQPYFAKARIAAAGMGMQGTLIAAQRREPLLREALAIAPDSPVSETIRVAIFRADAELHADALAIAAIGPLLSQLQAVSTQPSTEPDTTDANASDVSNERAPDDADSSPKAPEFHVVSDRAELLSEVSDVSWRSGQEPESVQYLQRAIKLSQDDQHKKLWQQKLLQRRAILRREQLNASRRPSIHASLDQSSAVRPRLQPAKETR